MHDPEIEARGCLHLVDHIRIVLRADAGKLNLDPIVANGSDYGFGDAEAIDARTDDLDRLLQLFLPLIGIDVLARLVPRLEGEGHAALQIETELQPAAREAIELVEQNVIPLLDILQRAFEPDMREILREVDLPLGADLLQRDELTRGLEVLDACRRFIEQFPEFSLFRGGMGANVGGEGYVLDRNKLHDRPRHDGEAQHELPEVAFEHWSIGLKGRGFCCAKT